MYGFRLIKTNEDTVTDIKSLNEKERLINILYKEYARNPRAAKQKGSFNRDVLQKSKEGRNNVAIAIFR
jgi:hypothetical protein